MGNVGIPKSARYDPSGLLGSPSPVNIIVGARSLGKTYGFTKRAVRNWIEKKEEWIYLRRYDTELKDSKTGDTGSFFSQIESNQEFPEWELRTLGNLMQIRKTSPEEVPDKEKPKWQTFGYFLALSKAQSYKGLNLAKVSMIVFDEFILERRVPPYLQGEPDRLMNLWETVDRRNDRVKVFMLANAADIVNPYFTQWGLQLPTKGKTKTYKYRGSSITIQYADDAEFRKYSKATNIGAFTSGSSYEQYALENSFLNNTTELIGDKPSTAHFHYSLVFNNIEYGVWIDYKRGDFYVNRKIPDQEHPTFTLIRDDIRPNILMLERINPLMRALKRAIMEGYTYFDSVQTRSNFLVGMELLGIR